MTIRDDLIHACEERDRLATELRRMTERCERMMADRDRMTMAFLDQLRVRGVLIEPNQDTLCPSCFNGHCELHEQVDDGRCRCPNCVDPDEAEMARRRDMAEEVLSS